MGCGSLQLSELLSTVSSFVLLIFPILFRFQSFGFNLVAQSAYHWQLSFSQAEQVLFEQLDEDGGCRRQCFQVLRQLKEDVWCPGRRPVITTHHLQVSTGVVGVDGATVSRWVPLCDGIRMGSWEWFSIPGFPHCVQLSSWRHKPQLCITAVGFSFSPS